jgi:hypothetical protein
MTTSTASAAVEAATSPQPPVKQLQHKSPSLYRDTLHHIFAFLTLQEVAQTAQAQKTWMATACSMKLRCSKFVLEDAADQQGTPMLSFDSLLRSPLRHHFTSFVVSARTLKTPHRLLHLRACVPHLTSLSFQLQLSSDKLPWDELWPPMLTRLEVYLDGLEPPENEYSQQDEEVAREMEERDRIIVGVGRSISRLERLNKLIVHPSFRWMPEEFLAPLVSMQHLTELTIDARMDEDTMLTLRRFAALQKLQFQNFSAYHLNVLVEGEDAPIPPFKSVADAIVLNHYSMTSMVRLAPTLTELYGLVERISTAPMLALARLICVTKLTIRFFTRIPPLDILHVVNGLRQMPQLTYLKFEQPHPLTSDVIAAFLPTLRALQTLHVQLGPSATSLAFLTHASASLTDLRLKGQVGTVVKDVQWENLSQQLQVLELDKLEFADNESTRSLGQQHQLSDGWDRKVWPNLRLLVWK